MSKAVKVGIFLVGGIALFCVGLFLIGSQEQLFGDHFVVYTEFNNISGLQSGAKVRVSGMAAGQVTAIQVPKDPSSKFRLKLKIDEKFHPIIRKDSTATIETSGFVGNQFVDVKKGTVSSPVCPAGCTIPGKPATSMAQLMKEGSKLATTLQSTIEDVHHRADAAIDNMTAATGNVNKLIVGVTPNIEHIAGNANAITADIRHGKGAAGKLLTDRKVAANVDATIANARKTSENLKQASGRADQMIAEVQKTDLPAMHKTMENAEGMTHQLNHAVGTFLSPGKHNQSTAKALRETVHGAQETMTNLSDDTEALKTNFFFRGFFNRRGFYNLSTLTPSKYDATEFVKKPRERVWIAASKLFKVGPHGSQMLTDAGKAKLDQGMSKLVPYLPNNPIVVEGYSTKGPQDKQYIASRQRAIEVRRYLESRFHLDPERVGIMPLGDKPPHGTHKKVWNGICLALVVSKK